MIKNEAVIPVDNRVEIKDCATYFLYDPRNNRYTDKTVILYKDDRFGRVDQEVWSKWCDVIKEHIEELKHSEDFDDVCEKLYKLKIKGVGSEIIIATAAQIVYKYGLPIDDSCWRVGYLQTTSVCRALRRCCGKEYIHFLNYVIKDFGELSLPDKVLCVLSNADKIKAYLKQQIQRA